MTKRSRDLRKRGTRAVTAGSGQATSSAGREAAARSGAVFHRVAPARPSALRQPALPIWPASGARRCRTVARRERYSQKQRATSTLTLPFAAMPMAAIRKELICPTRL
jgi:hypothetical protein